MKLLENQPGFYHSFGAKLYKDMFAQPRFQNEYLPVVIIAPDYDKQFQTYIRKGYISRLKESGFKVILLTRHLDL